MVRLYPDPCLRVPARPVTPGAPGAREAARCLREAYAQVEGLGLAAPQLGLESRVVLVELGQENMLLLNPRITYRSQERVVDTEGCLSFPGLHAGVARAREVTVEALLEDGSPVELSLQDLEARVIQHEIDHLDGILFVDHLPPRIREQLLAGYKAQREEEPSHTA